MIKYKFEIILLFFVCAFSLQTVAQGYDISIKFSDLKDTIVILGYRMDGKMLVKDTAEINSKGHATFKGDESLHAGMYFIYLPSQNVFNVLIDKKEQQFSISTSSENYMDDIKFKGNHQNEAFYAYERFLRDKGNEIKPLHEKLKKFKKENNDSLDIVSQQVDKINGEVDAMQLKLINENPNTFLSVFIKATRRVDVPEPPDTVENKDRWKYFYYKEHFFDNFDFSHEGIIRTALFKPKLTEYFEKVISQIPDSIIKESTKIIEKARQDKEVFKYVLGTLYNKFNSSKVMGHDAVFVHLAEYYINGDADWAGQDFIDKLKERVTKTQNNLIGIRASEFTAITLDNKWVALSQVKHKFVVLFFYEPGCSHCKKETPKMKKVYDRLKEWDVEVIGFYTQGDTVEWKEFVEKLHLDWLNVWSPHSNQYRTDYNIYSTPTVYLLDKNKEIIAKRVDSEQIEKIVTERLLAEKLKQIDDKKDEKKRMEVFKNFVAQFHYKESIEIAKEIIFLYDLSDKQKEDIEKVVEKALKKVEKTTEG